VAGFKVTPEVKAAAKKAVAPVAPAAVKEAPKA